MQAKCPKGKWISSNLFLQLIQDFKIHKNIHKYYMFLQIHKFKWRRQWQPTPVLLPGKSHGWRSLVGCSPWGREESGTTERLHFHFSLSCIGEGNGSPLQCSCLENPRDGGAWWAAIYGVTQGQTRLKRLSSNSSKFKSLKMYIVIIKIILKTGNVGKIVGTQMALVVQLTLEQHRGQGH